MQALAWRQKGPAKNLRLEEMRRGARFSSRRSCDTTPSYGRR